MRNTRHLFRNNFNRLAIPAILVLPILFLSQTVRPDECAQYKNRISQYEQLRRKGGKIKQMELWKNTLNELDSKLKQCISDHAVQIVSGSTSKTKNAAQNRTEIQVRVASEATQEFHQILTVRKLKDCIKPNNLIDNDVSECMKGNLEPVWDIRKSLK